MFRGPLRGDRELLLSNHVVEIFTLLTLHQHSGHESQSQQSVNRAKQSKAKQSEKQGQAEPGADDRAHKATAYATSRIKTKPHSEELTFSSSILRLSNQI